MFMYCDFITHSQILLADWLRCCIIQSDGCREEGAALALLLLGGGRSYVSAPPAGRRKELC